jgi:hypothetical protein
VIVVDITLELIFEYTVLVVGVYCLDDESGRLNFDESFVIIVSRHSNLFQSQIFLFKFIFF